MGRVDLEEFDDLVNWFNEWRKIHDDWSIEWANHVLRGERYLLCSIEDETFREQVVTFTDRIWRSSGLEPSERELVILAVATELDSRPLWQQHVRVGLDIGIPRDVVLAISDSDVAQLEGRDRAIAQFATKFVRGAVTDVDYQVLESHVDDETAVGIGLLAASYVTFERVLKTLQIDVTEEFVGWKLSNI